MNLNLQLPLDASVVYLIFLASCSFSPSFCRAVHSWFLVLRKENIK